MAPAAVVSLPGTSPDPVIRALEAELSRAHALLGADAEAPYFLAAQVLEHANVVLQTYYFFKIYDYWTNSKISNSPLNF